MRQNRCIIDDDLSNTLNRIKQVTLLSDIPSQLMVNLTSEI